MVVVGASVVVGSHGSVVAATVVGGSEATVVEVVVVDVAAGVVSAGAGRTVASVAGTVVVGASVVGASVVGAVAAGQSATSNGDDNAAGTLELLVGCCVAEGAALLELAAELVWPSMRWSTVNVEDS